jgi:hypothetical protein
MFKALGHDHLIATEEISGLVQFDAQKIDNSEVRLKAGARSLTVIDLGESEKDRRDVQVTLTGAKVLDTTTFPEIVSSSTNVSAVKKAADGWELTLSGKLDPHGAKKPVPPATGARGRRPIARPRRSIVIADRIWYHAGEHWQGGVKVMAAPIDRLVCYSDRARDSNTAGCSKCWKSQSSPQLEYGAKEVTL